MIAKYETTVYRSNRGPESGIPVTVYAASMDEAMTKAARMGSGDPDRTRVTVHSVEEEQP